MSWGTRQPYALPVATPEKASKGHEKPREKLRKAQEVPEKQKTPPVPGWSLRESVSGCVLLSHTVTSAVPSALKGLASGFGMGPGVSPSPWQP